MRILRTEEEQSQKQSGPSWGHNGKPWELINKRVDLKDLCREQFRKTVTLSDLRKHQEREKQAGVRPRHLEKFSNLLFSK